MKKTLVLGAALAAATLAAGAASAQGYDGYRRGYDSYSYRYADSDRDGVPNRYEWNRDRDRDGRPDQWDRYDNRRDWRRDRDRHHRHDRHHHRYEGWSYWRR
jgi:hypothetical protein